MQTLPQLDCNFDDKDPEIEKQSQQLEEKGDLIQHLQSLIRKSKE